MNDITVFIPTKGRLDKQYTYDIVKATGNHLPILVCPPEEVPEHEKRGRRAVGFAHTYLSQSIDHIIHVLAHTDRVIIMDDDLRFSRRISKDDWKLRMADPTDIRDMVDQIADLLTEHPMVGVSARQNNNNLTADHHTTAMRQSQVHGIYVPFFKEHGIHPDNVILKSDFYMTLNVLTRGKANAVLTQFTVDQAGGSNAPGGVSIYRSVDSMNTAAILLQSLFPQFVKLREKTTKWKGLETSFMDVTIFWKKALEAGQRGGCPMPAEPVYSDEQPAPQQDRRAAI